MQREITHKEAMQNPELRQGYVDFLVSSSGKSFPAVSSFGYLSEAERIALEQQGKLHNTNPERDSGLCVPSGDIGDCTSTIYLLENNFNQNFVRFYSGGITQRDIQTVQQLELCVHEAAHAEHFATGKIGDFSLDDFDLTKNQGRLLFMTASELDAHGKVIRALGEAKGETNYIKKMQEGFLRFYKLYLGSLPQMAKTPGFNPILARKIFDKYNALRYKSPSYETLVLP